MNAHRLLWIMLAAVTAVRLCLAGVLEINPSEAYFWLCSERWSWAFFDGPGGTAALVRASTDLFGQTPLGVRFFFPLAAIAASMGAYLLGRWTFNPATGLWTAIALNLLPGFNLAAIQAAPAVPALACWLFAAAFTWRAINSNRSALPAWFGAGLSLALGLQFSYSTAFALIPMVAYPLLIRRSRPRFREAGPWLAIALTVASALRHMLHSIAKPWLAIALTAASAAPLVAWHIANGWAPAALGTTRTAFDINPLRLGIPVADALLAVSPLMALAAAFLLVASARESRIHLRPRFFLLWSSVPFGLWLYAALRGQSLPFEAILTAIIIVPAGIGAWLSVSGLRAVPATVVVISMMIASSIAMLAPDRSITAIFDEDTADGWKAVARGVLEIRDEARNTQPDQVFVIAKDSAMTSMLAYQLAASPDPAPEVFLRESQDLSNQFGLWPRYDDFVETTVAPDESFEEVRGINPYMGRAALYVTDETPQELPQTITGAFSRVTPAARIEIRRNGKLLREVRTYFCEDYQTMPL
jgi:hypothetical protein